MMKETDIQVQEAESNQDEPKETHTKTNYS